MQTPNLFKFLIYAATLFIFLSFTYFAYLLFYTPKYFEVTEPLALNKKVYKIGEILTYTADYCKYREYIPKSVKRNLVGAYSYPLPDVALGATSLVTFPVGCRTINVEVPLALPGRVPTGLKNPYHVEVTIEYKINALQNQTRTFKTEVFTLTP